MKISARNTVSGGVTHIEKGPAMTAVTLDAQNWKLVTAITSQAAEDLQLARRSGEGTLQIDGRLLQKT